MRRIAIPLFLFLSVFLVIMAFFAYKCEAQKIFLEAEKQKLLLEKKKADWMALKQALEKEVKRFAGETSIVVKDLGTDWEIAFNKNRSLPVASLVKIPIMAACFKADQEGRISLQDTVELKNASKASGSGVLKTMPVGSTLSIEQLVEYMITESDNTATNMLIDLLGFDYLNSFFKKMGLKNTSLSRKMMDFKHRKQGIENYTCAEDIVMILEKIYRKELLNKEVSGKCLELLKHQKINDRIPAKLPQDATVAHKTGLERSVCHDAGIVFTP